MLRSSLCLPTLFLFAHHGSALIIRNEELVTRKTHLATASSNATQGPRTALLQKSSARFPVLLHLNGADPILVRPMAGQGPDYVKFGLVTKNFYGAKPRNFNFNVDVVMSLAWQDERVARLIPEGLEKLSMSLNQALTKIWMPGVVVTNKDIEKYEVVSSSVTIYRSGYVLRVERAQVRCLWKFELEQYPFDTQNLRVKIASSKYMFDEVVLVPDRLASGVDENIWGLYDLQSWKVGVYNDTDGHLEKSRGYINMEITRQLEKYFDDHLVPCAICLAISWAVFYFPFANPFITPRLALSIIALLTFTNLMIKSLKELPGSAPFNWNDLFNQQIQALMFCTIVLNIVSEIFHHQFKNEELAHKINNHAKLLIPSMSVFNISVILLSGGYHLFSIRTVTSLTKAILFVTLGTYAGWIAFGIWVEMKATHEEEMRAKEEDNEADADADGDADAGC